MDTTVIMQPIVDIGSNIYIISTAVAAIAVAIMKIITTFGGRK